MQSSGEGGGIDHSGENGNTGTIFLALPGKPNSHFIKQDYRKLSGMQASKQTVLRSMIDHKLKVCYEGVMK